MNIRRVVSKSRQKKSGQRSATKRRGKLFFQTLEDRRLLALLTNGQGPGDVRIEVNEQGAFGASASLAVNNPSSPPGNGVGDAWFTPAGASGPQGAVYESGVAIGLLPSGAREFLTAGTIAGTGNNASGFFTPPSAETPQNNGERHSRFFWPNSAAASSPGAVPSGAMLAFDLEQSLVDLQEGSSQDGTALVQEYKVTNVSSSPLSFELVRYFDGDLFTAVSGGGSATDPLLDSGGAKTFDPLRGVTVFQTDGDISGGGGGGGGGGGFGGGAALPTVGEVDNGTFIDNDVPTSTPGYFGFEPAAGGSALSSEVTVRGRSGSLFQQQDFIFDFNNFIDVGSDGGAIDLSSTTVTMSPTLVSPDLVVSEGHFSGPNGQVNWRAETTLMNGDPTVFNTIRLSSSSPLGNIRFINYLDEDVFGPNDDILFTTGTPGQPDFRAFTLDGPERVGFGHGGVYQPGSGLANATYEGWAADEFSELRDDITGPGTSYSVSGNIDTAALPPFSDPELGQVFGPEDITTAFAWRVDPNATSATITTFLELVPQDPGGGEPTFIGVQATGLGASGENWEVGLAGNTLPVKSPGDLLSRIVSGQPLRNDIIPFSSDTNGDGVRDSAADVAVAKSQRYVNVEPGETVVFTTLTVFGHPPGSLVSPPTLGTIQGIKFEDSDGDGQRDSGESGVAGFQIFADLNQNGSLDSGEPFDVTDSAGNYSLRVSPGSHRVREVLLSGWTRTTPASGFHAVNVSGPGAVVTGIDFGNKRDVGRIEGVKFNDADGDGTFDTSESGVSGVTIFLDEDDDGQLDSGEPSTVTNSQGDYAFPNLAPGDYVVREIVPSGRQQTFPGGDGAHRVTVSTGQTVDEIDFGNRVMGGAISGVVWNDLNRNGVFEPSEFRVSMATVFLDSDNDGVRDSGEPQTTTNSQGMYSFSNVAPGSYIVREIVPSDFVQTFPPSGFHSVNVVGGQTTSNVNFGNVRGEIRGVKFDDANGNGSQGPNEFGISGVTIYLDLDDDAFLDASEPQTLTDSSGGYVFQNLGPGPYVVREIVPSGFVQTSPGGDGARRATLAAGQIVSGQDFGNQSGSPEAESASPATTPEDVDRSGRVDLFDLVTVIAAVRASQEQAFAAAPANPADVTGDQRLLLNDVLKVVQYLRNASPAAEGEGDPAAADPAPHDRLAPLFDLLASDIIRRRR